MKLLVEVPAHKWTPGSELAADTGAAVETLDELAGKGLLVSSAADPALEHLRQRGFADVRLVATGEGTPELFRAEGER